MIRFLFLGIILVSSLNIFSQKSVNDYEYIIVPRTFEFLKKEDAYQLNSLTKFLFNKYGFNAYVQGKEMPKELKENSCRGLLVHVKKSSSLFITKLNIELKNCEDQVVFVSAEGTSREKEFKKAYHEALRDAFKDVQKLNYKYNESQEEDKKIVQITPVPVTEKQIISAEKEKAVEIKNEVSTSSGDYANQVSRSYVLNNKVFVFKKKEYGYELSKKEGEKLISSGKIYKLRKDNSYLINGGDLSGSGYFDSFGNFILERVNPVTDKIILDTFARQ